MILLDIIENIIKCQSRKTPCSLKGFPKKVVWVLKKIRWTIVRINKVSSGIIFKLIILLRVNPLPLQTVRDRRIIVKARSSIKISARITFGASKGETVTGSTISGKINSRKKTMVVTTSSLTRVNYYHE